MNTPRSGVRATSRRCWPSDNLAREWLVTEDTLTDVSETELEPALIPGPVPVAPRPLGDLFEKASRQGHGGEDIAAVYWSL